MSRSYRKPYAAATGTCSAKDDKRQANRGVRSRQNQWLRNLEEFDDSLIPHRFECSFNEVWCWGRDGHQWYQTPSARERTSYELTQQGLFRNEYEEARMRRYHGVWPPVWYTKLKRK